MSQKWRKENYLAASESLIEKRKKDPGWLYNSGTELEPPYEVAFVWTKRTGNSISNLINVRTPQNKRPFFDFFSELFLEKTDNNPKKYFENVAISIRDEEKEYWQKSHDGVVAESSTHDVSSRRKEEHEEMALFNYCKDISTAINTDKEITIVDYAMPLYNEQSDPSKLGEVDLVGISSDCKTVYLLELKNMKSKETLLRSALEIYTYYARLGLNKDKETREIIERLRKDYGKVFSDINNVKAGIIILCGSNQYNVFKEMMNPNDRKYFSTKKLIKELGLEIFVVNKYRNDKLILFENDDDFLIYEPYGNEQVKPAVKLEKPESLKIEKVEVH